MTIDNNKSGFLTHVSLLRVVAMMTVIMYHSLCYFVVWSHPVTAPAFKAGPEPWLTLLAHFLTRTNMPTFVFLSGFLYAHLRIEAGKYRDTGRFVWGKVKRLLIPYLFWSLALIVCFPLSHHNFTKILFGFCHLWFLLMLFEEALLFHFTARWWQKWPRWADWLALLLLMLLQYHFRGLHLSAHEPLMLLKPLVINMPYYALGIVCQKCMSQWHRAPWPVFALLAVESGTMVAVLLGGLRMWRAGFFYVLSVLTFVVSLFFLFRAFCQSRPGLATNKLLHDLDRCSMGIYITHHIFIEAMTHIDVVKLWLNAHYYMGPVLLFGCALAVGWAITHFMLKTRLRVLFG